MEEVWKDVNGYEGLYQVSNMGRVRSMYTHGHRIANNATRILSAGNVDGYQMVVLCKDGKKKNVGIHRLVAVAFIPNPNNYPLVNHKDENPANNIFTNLEWCTNKYNLNYGTAMDRRSVSKSKSVLQYSKDGTLIKRFNKMQDVMSEGFQKSGVCRCCQGKQKLYRNYIWRYE